jgi:hypothetical protein
MMLETHIKQHLVIAAPAPAYRMERGKACRNLGWLLEKFNVFLKLESEVEEDEKDREK